MNRSPAFRFVALALAAVYLIEALLAGGAHVHNQGDCCGTEHSVAAKPVVHVCSHGHRHGPANKPDLCDKKSDDTPCRRGPLHDENCAACRFLALVVVPTTSVGLELCAESVSMVSERSAAAPAQKAAARYHSRAPPLA